jgi:hypothetical protein
MPASLSLIFVGALFLYVVYLRIQLYIQRRIINAFQSAAVIVPPSKPKADPRMGFFGIGMLLLAIGVFASLVAR